MDECHLEVGTGGSEQALGKGDTIGATITDKADVYVRPGATKEGLGPAAAAAAAAEAAAAAAAADLEAKKGERLPAVLVLRCWYRCASACFTVSLSWPLLLLCYDWRYPSSYPC